MNRVWISKEVQSLVSEQMSSMVKDRILNLPLYSIMIPGREQVWGRILTKIQHECFVRM